MISKSEVSGKAGQAQNVVAVVDAGQTQNGIYIAMEYLPNGSAADECGSNGFAPLRRARAMVADALRGLDYLHSRGFVNADIKPSNIMIGEGGRAKLADFGLVTQLSPSGKSRLGLAYRMHRAPESVKDGTVSVATDIYQAGITLYRLVNGDSFLKDGPDVNDRIIDGTFPDRSAFQPFVPLRLRRIICRALEPDPDNRFASADEFRHALERVSVAGDWELGTTNNTAVWGGASMTHDA